MTRRIMLCLLLAVGTLSAAPAPRPKTAPFIGRWTVVCGCQSGYGWCQWRCTWEFEVDGSYHCLPGGLAAPLAGIWRRHGHTLTILVWSSEGRLITCHRMTLDHTMLVGTVGDPASPDWRFEMRRPAP